MIWLDDDSALPATRTALGPGSDTPGLLAAGGTLSLERLTEAYRRGVFPWFSEGQPPLWWSPDPRMVLPVAEFRLSHSLRKTLRKALADGRLDIRVDHAFERVIAACAGTPRPGQRGTWILPAMCEAYTRWHRAGAVHSFETWWDGELVGGLYAVAQGRMIFGESMFAHRTDASKLALAALVAWCRARGVVLIDCQQNTHHLASLGARVITRARFETHLAASVDAAPLTDWRFRTELWAGLLEPPGATPAPAAPAAAPGPMPPS